MFSMIVVQVSSLLVFGFMNKNLLINLCYPRDHDSTWRLSMEDKRTGSTR